MRSTSRRTRSRAKPHSRQRRMRGPHGDACGVTARRALRSGVASARPGRAAGHLARRRRARRHARLTTSCRTSSTRSRTRFRQACLPRARCRCPSRRMSRPSADRSRSCGKDASFRNTRPARRRCTRSGGWSASNGWSGQPVRRADRRRRLDGARLYGPACGLVALGLGLISPFILFQAGSYLSHPIAGGLRRGRDRRVRRGRARRSNRWYAVCGVLLGMTFLVREVAAVLVALPLACGCWRVAAGGPARSIVAPGRRVRAAVPRLQPAPDWQSAAHCRASCSTQATTLALATASASTCATRWRPGWSIPTSS